MAFGCMPCDVNGTVQRQSCLYGNVVNCQQVYHLFPCRTQKLHKHFFRISILFKALSPSRFLTLTPLSLLKVAATNSCFFTFLHWSLPYPHFMQASCVCHICFECTNDLTIVLMCMCCSNEREVNPMF